MAKNGKGRVEQTEGQTVEKKEKKTRVKPNLKLAFKVIELVKQGRDNPADIMADLTAEETTEEINKAIKVAERAGAIQTQKTVKIIAI